MHQPARFILLWIGLILFWGGAAASADEASWQPAQMVPESQMPFLGELLEHATSQAPQIVARNIELAQVEAARITAKSAQLPSLGASAREVYQAVSLSSGDGGYNTGNGFFYNAALRQPIFHWGTLSASTKVAELSVKMKQREYAEGYRLLVGSIRSQFMGLVLQKMAVAAREQALAEVKSKYELDSRKVADGVLGRSALRGVQLALMEAELNLRRAKSDYDNGRRMLAILSGIQGIPDERVPDFIPAAPIVESSRAAGVVGSGVRTEDLPMAQFYKTKIEQDGLDYKIAKYRLYPKLDLNISTGLDNQISTSSKTVAQDSTYRHNVALTVSWNIFDGFAAKGARLRALADKRASEQQLASYIKNVEAARILALEQLAIVLDTAELAEERLNDARGSLKYAEGEVQAGRMAEGQLGNIRIGLQNTEAAAAKARMDVYVKWSEILGTAWADPMLKKIPSSFLSYDR